MEDLVTYDQEFGKYYFTKFYEDEAEPMKYIEEFENETFWDELVDRLAKRDVVNEHGLEATQAMDIMERFEALGKYEEYYNDEFEEHGLARLRVVEEKP